MYFVTATNNYLLFHDIHNVTILKLVNWYFKNRFITDLCTLKGIKGWNSRFSIWFDCSTRDTWNIRFSLSSKNRKELTGYKEAGVHHVWLFTYTVYVLLSVFTWSSRNLKRPHTETPSFTEQKLFSSLSLCKGGLKTQIQIPNLIICVSGSW